jgi:hypothetical protein
MTEAQWLTCTAPEPLLEYLFGRGSGGKLRLFAVACCRRVDRLLPDARSRRLLDLLERWADGRVGRPAVEEGVHRHDQFLYGMPRYTAFHFAARAVDAAAVEAAWKAAWNVVAEVHNAVRRDRHAEGVQEAQAQADLLRHLFGNPFRPVAIDPSWLTWNDATIPRLARALSDEGPSAHLGVLLDALQEAGCTAAPILGHLRRPGPHPRGCWAIDALRGQQ